MRTGRDDGSVGMDGDGREKEKDDEEGNSGGGRRAGWSGEVAGGGDDGAEAEEEEEEEDEAAEMDRLRWFSGGELKAVEAEGAVLRRAGEEVMA